MLSRKTLTLFFNRALLAIVLNQFKWEICEE